ncbi:MAG: putative metal-dependent hydrolase [Ktedonobacterales bacterium]|jgi:predicted metal-dependent hydrolase|nr:MAG: putative metal-dependent hydrolase [Ktedonobacterales bacterium]
MATNTPPSNHTPAPRRARPTTTPAATLPEPRELIAYLDGHPVPYLLRVSARARRLCLRIQPPGRLEVVVPRRTPQTRIDDILRQKSAWIRATLTRMQQAATAIPAPVPLADGRILPYAGRQLRLAVRTGAPAGHFSARLEGDLLELRVPDTAEPTIRAALTIWYRREARRLFAERLALCNASYGFTYGRVTIKEQKSRWGSCSRLGNLNFNWRLLLAPLPVLDYVVTHELCHLKELNHSPSFWRLVAHACPDYATHRRWLRQHGHELHF